MVIQTKSNSVNGSDNGNSEESNVGENAANIKLKSESATSVLNALRKRKIQSMQTNGVDSLEILKDNLQYFFNEKVNTLMKDFLHTFFDPAIRNIKENTSETISDQQIKKICKSLLENCVKSQYSSSNDSMSSPSSSSLSNTPDINTSDSDTSENGGTSLLHQALKRKRTDSETEQLFKRQFFLTTAPPNQYFNEASTGQNVAKPVFRPATSVLSSSPRFITRPLQPGIFTQSGSSTRPIFHIIQAPNRNLKLSATHVELCQLLKQNNSSISSITTSSLPTSSSSSSAATTVTITATESVKPASLPPPQGSTSKETESKN